MIEIEQQAPCQRCGKPVDIKEIGPNKKAWCSPACKQAAYRERQARKHRNVPVDESAQERIAQLEQELARYRQTVDFLQRESGSKTRFERDALRSSQDQITELKQCREGLEQELAEANELIGHLLDKKQSHQPLKRSLQERLTRILEQRDWPALDIHYRVNPGRKNGHVFILGASVDLLSRTLAQLEKETS